MSDVVRKTLTGAAALCFIAAWFLPAVPEVPGWMAFRYALSPLWPYHDAGMNDSEDAIISVLSALTNVVFMIMLGMSIARRVKHPGLFWRVAIACLVADLYWLVQFWRDGSAGDLRVGYYAWLGAFAFLIALGWGERKGDRSI